ncbi:MAG: alpha/beta hydrolase [Betaproteobacteria bacterium]|nr:MAG: alpha/beta hydrolase [Betaproteobacteria bacterium]
MERRELNYAPSLKAHYYAPSGAGKFPAVIAVHGGGWRLENLELYRYLGPWLAEHGYAVLAITYRLATPERKTYPEAVDDVRAALRFARTDAKLGIDAGRIALMGDSSGAHLAALVALTEKQPVKAVIGVYGVYDLAAQWRHDQLSRPRDHIVERFLGASLIDDRRIYFDASPISYVSAKNNSTAFLVAWGTADDVVDYRTQSEAFLEALKQAGHYARPAVLEGAPHFWVGDPLEEEGSHSAFFAHRLLRFLRAKV